MATVKHILVGYPRLASNTSNNKKRQHESALLDYYCSMYNTPVYKLRDRKSWLFLYIKQHAGTHTLHGHTRLRSREHTSTSLPRVSHCRLGV